MNSVPNGSLIHTCCDIAAVEAVDEKIGGFDDPFFQVVVGGFGTIAERLVDTRLG